MYEKKISGKENYDKNLQKKSNEYLNDEDSPEELEENIEKNIKEYETKEKNSPINLYFEFDSPETREAAIKKILEFRFSHPFDERILYLLNVNIDPQRPDVGLTLEYTKPLKSLDKFKKEVESLIEELGFEPKEEYIWIKNN